MYGRGVFRMFKKFSLILCGLIAAGSISVAAAQEVNVSLNGELIDFETANPVVKDSRTLIPLRGLFEKMGYDIDWEPKTKAAILTRDGNTISIRANKEYITVNNIQIETDVPAQIIDGYMMIPLRVVADSTGATVDWDAETKIVSVNSNVDREYTLDMEEYVDDYMQIIEPLEYLDDVAAQLNTLNSDSSRANINTTVEMLNTASETIASVRKKIKSLNPPEKFEEFQNLSLESLDLQKQNIQALLDAVSGDAAYDKTTNMIGSILEQSKDINRRISQLSL